MYSLIFLPLFPSSSTMNGLEIFGGVGSAVAVIEAIWLVKSHITSAKQAKQEKIDMEAELKELKSLMQHIRNTLDRQLSLTSKPTLLNLLSRIDEGLNRVDKKRKGTWKIFWHLVKDDIRSIWANLKRMRGFLELGLISQIGEGVSEHQQENAAYYTMMMDDLKRDLDGKLSIEGVVSS
ncbi:hypothetical protein DL96DRAFT_241520 [Flagelloscypha sp. PMI_526]|nr:hypothetical protein DL96DRAFT_241520 [Flagelloscypha sp. PMI_526]